MRLARHPSPPARPHPPAPQPRRASAPEDAVLTHAPLLVSLAAAQPSGSRPSHTLYTMREAVSLHMGQSGVQTGNACWELYVSRPTEHQRPADPGWPLASSCVLLTDGPRWLRCAATAWSTGSSRTARCPPTRYAPQQGPLHPHHPAVPGLRLDLAAVHGHITLRRRRGARQISDLDGPLLRRGA